jgi:hypothetical protein
MDRLIIELKMSPLEVYFHIRGILEQLNSVVAEQFASLLLEKSVDQQIIDEVDIKSFNQL